MRPPQAERPQDWRVLMALFSFALFLESAAWGHLVAFTPLYLREELLLPSADVPRWTGLLAASSLAVAFPLSPFWGVLADRYGRKIIIVRSQIVKAIAYAGIALAGGVGQLLAIRLLIGLSFGNVAVGIATQSLVTPDRRIGYAVGVIQMAIPVAVSVGPLFGSFLINTIGLRGMFLVDSLLALAAALLIAIFVREPKIRDRKTSLGKRLVTVFREVASMPPLRWNFTCWFLFYCGLGAVEPFLPIAIGRLSTAANPATTIGLVLGAYGLLTGIGTPLAGRLVDRIGSARLLIAVLPIAVLAALGIAWAPALAFLVVAVVLATLPQASVAPALYAHLAAHTPRERRAAVMSLSPMPRNAAMLIGPAVAAAVFWFAATAYALVLPFAILLGRAPKTPSAADRPERISSP